MSFYVCALCQQGCRTACSLTTAATEEHLAAAHANHHPAHPVRTHAPIWGEAEGISTGSSRMIDLLVCKACCDSRQLAASLEKEGDTEDTDMAEAVRRSMSAEGEQEEEADLEADDLTNAIQLSVEDALRRSHGLDTDLEEEEANLEEAMRRSLGLEGGH